MNTSASGPSAVLVELTIAAPAEDVWAALRDPVLINRWFGWDATTLAEEIDFIFIQHATADDGARRVRFEGMSDEFEVVERGDGCVVRLIRHGAAGDDSDWDGVYEDVSEGWLAFLTQLRFALERHPGQERRTLYLNGRVADGAGGRHALARLGFDALDGLSAGDRYELAIGTGETLTGEIWHRSRRQLALTVDDYGDGLVLITDRSAENQPPAGGGSVTVTTYGMSNARFVSLADRWSGFWSNHFPTKLKATTAEAVVTLDPAAETT